MGNFFQWKCICGYWNKDYLRKCDNCGELRLYWLTQHQARAVARELNRLEARCRWLEHRAIALNFAGHKMYWKRSCGHEQRFIIEGLSNFTDEEGTTRWGMGRCALCNLENLRAELEHWKKAADENLRAASNIAGVVDDLYRKQLCGHEARFILSGDDHDIDPHGESGRGKTNWCALCGLESLRAELRERHAAERWAEEVIDESGRAI